MSPQYPYDIHDIPGLSYIYVRAEGYARARVITSSFARTVPAGAHQAGPDRGAVVGARRLRRRRRAAMVVLVQENFATVLETVADVRADRTAVTHGDRSVTWRQLDDRSSRLAGFLAGRGIGAGARVAIALYNGIEYLESVFAILKVGAIPVNVNYRYQPDEMRHLFDDAQVSAVIFDASLAERVGAAQAGAQAARTMVQVGGAAEPPGAPVSGAAAPPGAPVSGAAAPPGAPVSGAAASPGAPVSGYEQVIGATAP